MHQRQPRPSPERFRLHVTERKLAAGRGHGNAYRLVLQQGDAQVQPLIGQPRLDVLDGLVVGPGGNDVRIVAMVERATDPDGALDDAADDAGVGRGCLAGVYGCFHGVVTSIR
ncbi:hypothetical protein D3C84_746530 [compost metagenome]